MVKFSIILLISVIGYFAETQNLVEDKNITYESYGFSERAPNYTHPIIKPAEEFIIKVDEESCLTALGFLNSNYKIGNDVVPCTLADEFFFIGTGYRISRESLRSETLEIDDYYPIFRRYLHLKNEGGIDPFEPGNPGLLTLGLASISTMTDSKK